MPFDLLKDSKRACQLKKKLCLIIVSTNGLNGLHNKCQGTAIQKESANTYNTKKEMLPNQFGENECYSLATECVLESLLT